MSFRHPPRRGAAFARPLVFSLLMVYGLASFLLGWQDWQQRHRLPLGAELALVVGGLVLGSAAIRVILRRRRAFGRYPSSPPCIIAHASAPPASAASI